MKKFLKKSLLLLALSASIFSFRFGIGNAIAADDLQSTLGFEYADNLDLPTSGQNDVRVMAVSIIKYLISFLGLIAVIIIIYGGFIWMTAAGNDDRVGKAKNIIIAGVIGLAIIIASYAIVSFVISIAGTAVEGDI